MTVVDNDRDDLVQQLADAILDDKVGRSEFGNLVRRGQRNVETRRRSDRDR